MPFYRGDERLRNKGAGMADIFFNHQNLAAKAVQKADRFFCHKVKVAPDL